MHIKSLALVCVFCFVVCASYAAKDSTYKGFTYFRVGIDASKPLTSLISKTFSLYEFQADVNYKRQLNLALEFGWGNSTISNEFIQYKSNNSFVRFGLDKTLFNAEFKGDFDNAFVGVRYGAGLVNRLNASYLIKDTIWGNRTGIIDRSSFTAHWLELDGGFKMEVVKNLFMGWCVRFKTFINPKKFESLPPAYVAGYGRGDKNTAFGYNFYILYGFGKR